MTNVSMYVYKGLEDYMLLYPGKQDKLTEDHLSALYISKKSVALVSDNKKGVAGYRPDLSKSLTYFDGGEKLWEEKYNEGFEPVVEVKINGDFVKFIGQVNSSSFTVAKFVGDAPMSSHVKGYILYDEEKMRLNLIMTPVPLVTG